MEKFLDHPIQVKAAVGFLILMYTASWFVTPIVFAVLTATLALFLSVLSIIVISHYLNMGARRREEVRAGKVGFWSGLF